MHVRTARMTELLRSPTLPRNLPPRHHPYGHHANYDVMFAKQASFFFEDAQCGFSSSKEANDDLVYLPSSAFSPSLAVLFSLSAAHLRR